MKGFSVLISTIAIILAIVSTITSTKAGVSSEEIAKALRDNPKLVVDALQAYQDQQRVAQERAAAEAVKKYAEQIKSSDKAAFVGPENATVTVTEFFDFSCGYCKRLAPTLEKVIENNPNVKFVFKPVSFVSPVSPYQAKASMAAQKQGKFLEFYAGLMKADGGMTEAKVDEIASSVGLDMDKYKADLNSDEVAQTLAEISSLSRSAGVSGVPALFINGKPVQAFSVDEIQNAINTAE